MAFESFLMPWNVAGISLEGLFTQFRKSVFLMKGLKLLTIEIKDSILSKQLIEKDTITKCGLLQ